MEKGLVSEPRARLMLKLWGLEEGRALGDSLDIYISLHVDRQCQKPILHHSIHIVKVNMET